MRLEIFRMGHLAWVGNAGGQVEQPLELQSLLKAELGRGRLNWLRFRLRGLEVELLPGVATFLT